MPDDRISSSRGFSDGRPEPDALLAKVASDEPSHKHGRLKIFFGYSAGVGKTYAMLSAARALEMKRGDVLVGYVEPHGRPETEALLLGLEILPYKRIQYRGIELNEFDLDEALRRKPKLLLVDELAHTNAEGCRHTKRWQDVEELLDSGIDVYTTLNVQHLESLNDVVGKISGIVVRETVPDSVFDRATDVELVDLPPPDLLERFSEGKVYVPEQAARATDRFFRRETLVALRELALRRTAEHVNRQVELGRRGLPTRPIWATRERLMVAVGPSPTSTRLVRAARRMATELRAPWFAVSVERPSTGSLSRHVREALDTNLKLAESLGAEVAMLHRDNVANALIEFARDRGVTRVLLGKTAEARWKQVLRATIVDRVIRASGDLDVLVISGDPEIPPSGANRVDRQPMPAQQRGSIFVHALQLVVALVLSLLFAMGFRAIGMAETNIIMVFLFAVALIAYFAGSVAAAVFSVLSVLAFNFFFTEPRYTFVVFDLQYLVTFSVMLAVGLVVSGLVGRVRAQANAASRRADANEVLHRLNGRLATTTGRNQIVIEIVQQLEGVLKLDAVVYLKESGSLGPGIGESSLVESAHERAVATWVLERGVEAGLGTDTLPNTAAWYLPLSPRPGETVGVLGVRPGGGRHELDLALRRLVQSVSTVVAQALDREMMAERLTTASVEAESERLRSDLLATVSHDLRTPLTTISGAASAVLHSADTALTEQDRRLLRDIAEEAERMARLMENLLQLGRLDEGRTTIAADWYPLEEIFDAALRQLPRGVSSDRIRVELPQEPVFVFADAVLLSQLVFNLLDNAIQHAGTSEITVQGGYAEHATRIQVLDRGPGLGERPARLFERFERGASSSSRGVGLGLAICRAITEAHAGTIAAQNRAGGGADFVVLLPFPKQALPPSICPDGTLEKADQE